MRKAAVLFVLTLVLLAACGKKDEKDTDVTKYEHIVRDININNPDNSNNNDNNNNNNDKNDEKPSITPTSIPDNNDVLGKPFTKDNMNFTPVDDTIEINASKVNIRTGPSTDYEVVHTAKSKDRFKRTAHGDKDWDQIEYNGQLVYIYSPYISVVKGDSMENNPNPTAPNVSLKQSKSLEALNIVDISDAKYTYEDMKSDLNELSKKYPESLTVNNLSLTKDGRTVYEAVLGNKDADNHIIIQASIHAREYMTTLLVMKQLEYYLYYMNDGNYNGTLYKDLFNSVAVHIVPMANPDGVTLSQLGLEGITRTNIKKNIKEWYEYDYNTGNTTYSLDEYLTRFKANANGVDLNRNFDYGWSSFKGSSKPSSEKYKGISPVSEPESAVLVDLTESLRPSAAISYHASGSVIYWDYGQDGDLKRKCEELVSQIRIVTGYEVKNASDDPQDAAGFGDWCVMSKGIPSATIEIGSAAAPLAISEFSDIWYRNWQVIAVLAWQYK